MAPSIRSILSLALLRLMFMQYGSDAFTYSPIYTTRSSYISTSGQSIYTTTSSYSFSCGQNTFTAPMGNITSPNYPYSYGNNMLCNYFITAPSLSTMNFTIKILYVESCCDYIQFVCQSNSIRRPVRYTGSNLSFELSFKPCTRVMIRFYSDGIVTGNGFFVQYNVDPIRCIGNCTPIAIGAGYNCTCDANQTDPFIAPPYNQCPNGCYLSSTSSDGYCVCNSMPTSPPSPPTVPSCSPGCYPYVDSFGYPLCYCNTTASPVSPASRTTPQCPYGCYVGQDSYGYQICYCQGTTRTTPCPFGCYNISYSYGYSYCECTTPVQTTPVPLTCPPGCTPDRDSWGTFYCRCSSGYGTTTPTSSPGCGGATLTSPRGQVTSPSYPYRIYNNYNLCLQNITVASATSIRLTFTDLNLYYSLSGSTCTYEWVQITGCDGSTAQYCSPSIVNVTIEFACTQNFSVIILFQPNYYGYAYNYRGFKLTYAAGFASYCSQPDGDGRVFLGGGGIITSPLYPNTYTISNDCYYLLQATDPSLIRIRVSFETLRMPSSPNCAVDYIKFSCVDGTGANTSVCGSSLPNPITFDCPTVEIKFHSESLGGITPKLFKIVYNGISRLSSNTQATTTSTVGSSSGTRVLRDRHPAMVIGLMMAAVIATVEAAGTAVI